MSELELDILAWCILFLVWFFAVSPIFGHAESTYLESLKIGLAMQLVFIVIIGVMIATVWAFLRLIG